MNCFSQEGNGGREPRPILARDSEYLDDRMLAEVAANFDPQTGDYSQHIDCAAHAWSKLKFSAGHPETGKYSRVSISAGVRAKGAAASQQSIHRRVRRPAAVSPYPAPRSWFANLA